MQTYDVIVAGLGAMGSAALDHLSGRGVKVLGIEPFGIAHGHGSSGGDTRLIRKAYFEHPDYVPLLERAYANWRSLEADTAETLLHTVGVLYMGQPGCELVAGSRRSAADHGLRLDVVDADTMQREFPRLCCPEGYLALWEPEAGFLLCERAVRAQVARAVDRGAVIATGERVLEWQAHADGVRVTTDRGSYAAGSLVLTAGSWSSRLLPGLDPGLRVTRQPLFWVQPSPREPFALGNVPCWAVQRPDAPGLFYGFPALPGKLAPHLGVKLAHHHPGDETDPDEPAPAARRAELEAILDALAPFVRELAGPATGSHVCLYTSTRDGHFVVDVHPGHANVVVACGFSGHGFKFASVMGEALADLALEGRSALPIDFLGFR